MGMALCGEGCPVLELTVWGSVCPYECSGSCARLISPFLEEISSQVLLSYYGSWLESLKTSFCFSFLRISLFFYWNDDIELLDILMNSPFFESEVSGVGVLVTSYLECPSVLIHTWSIGL